MIKTLKNLFLNAFLAALAIKPQGFISNKNYHNFYSPWIVFSSVLTDLQPVDQSENLALVFLTRLLRIL